MALSCCMFARAACECHSLWMSQPLFLESLDSSDYEITLPVGWFTSQNKPEEPSCSSCHLQENREAVNLLWLSHPKESVIHMHIFSACLRLETSTWAGLWLLWVCTREEESAFSNAVPCLWWQMEWPLLLADSLQSLLLNWKYFLTLFFSKGLISLNVLCTVDLIRF